MRAGLAVVVVVLVALASPAPTQGGPTDARTAVLASIAPGQRVRLATGASTLVDGPFVGLHDGHVVLASPERRVPLETVQAIWVRDRATRTGALVGGVGLGVATGGLFALVATALCTDDNCGGTTASAGAIGLFVGGAAGAATGGLAGSAVPKWRRVFPREADPPSPAMSIQPPPPVLEPPSSDRVGSILLHPGIARGRDRMAAPGGVGGHLRLSAEWREGFAAGFELGRFELGTGVVTSPRGRLEYHESLLHVGVAVTQTWRRGAVRPYLLMGVGHYTWRGFNAQVLDPDERFADALVPRHFLGGSLGGGLRVRESGPWAFRVEGRWHTSRGEVFQPAPGGPYQHWNMYSLTAGASLNW